MRHQTVGVTYQRQKKYFNKTDIIITEIEETATQTYKVDFEDEINYINDKLLSGDESDMLFDFQDEEENATKILKFSEDEHFKHC